MNLKNYTTSTPVINSINRIEYRLSQAGAVHISKSYDNNRPVGIMFQIMINNYPMIFKLPARQEKVYEFMRKQRKNPPTKVQEDSIRLQADKVAWKILSDWVDIQISLIQLDQAEIIELFLPYSCIRYVYNHQVLLNVYCVNCLKLFSFIPKRIKLYLRGYKRILD